MADTSSKSRRVADRLTVWARGADVNPTAAEGPTTIVCEAASAADWLRDPATGLVSESTVVFFRHGRRGGPGPADPGDWIPIAGAATEPGDEMEISRQFWLQTTDYVSLRYLGVAGPTVVRLLAADDVAAYLDDVERTSASGGYPEALLHPVVELGDRCALSGGAPCTTSGLPGRLHIDLDGDIRTSPAGRVLGRVGDTVSDLASAASACDGDVCVSAEVADELAGAEAVRLRLHLAALDAVRTMTLRTDVPWQVCGLGFSLLEDAVGDGDSTCAVPRDDFLVLASARDHVLFDVGGRRAFKVDHSVGQVLEVVLASSDDLEAATRLERIGLHTEPVIAIRTVRDALAARGVELSGPILEAAQQ